ncbi:MAG: 3-hydroxyacyl-ACP dehydratase FabZ family protein [Pirellulales bacterium]
MRFSLIDRILELRRGESIKAIKALSLSEEYLQDHFPRFPVMPGVFMLEAMFQTARWLLYHSEDFAHPCILLKEARNVKYADFVEPGEVLVLEATLFKQEGSLVTFKTQGSVGDKVAVSARLVLERKRLADENPRMLAADLYAERRMREIFQLLYQSAPITQTVV